MKSTTVWVMLALAAQLGQAALVVKDLSGGKGRLLTGQGASANVQVGQVARAPEWQDLPVISAYPVSTATKTKIEGIGDCVLIGAVTLLVPAEAPRTGDQPTDGRIAQAPPSGYLLAYKGELSDKEEESGTVYLVSVTVDANGDAAFVRNLGVPAKRHTRPADVICDGEDWYGASVRFPNRDQASKDNPAWRASVLIAPHEPDGRYRSYEFQLDLGVTME